MSFGPFKGQRVSEVPTPHLRFLVTIKIHWPVLAAAVAAELARRESAFSLASSPARNPGGRPKRRVDIEQVLKLKALGRSLRAIARELNIPDSTIRLHLKRCAETPLEGCAETQFERQVSAHLKPPETNVLAENEPNPPYKPPGIETTPSVFDSPPVGRDDELTDRTLACSQKTPPKTSVPRFDDGEREKILLAVKPFGFQPSDFPDTWWRRMGRVADCYGVSGLMLAHVVYQKQRTRSSLWPKTIWWFPAVVEDHLRSSCSSPPAPQPAPQKKTYTQADREVDRAALDRFQRMVSESMPISVHSRQKLRGSNCLPVAMCRADSHDEQDHHRVGDARDLEPTPVYRAERPGAMLKPQPRRAMPALPLHLRPAFAKFYDSHPEYDGDPAAAYAAWRTAQGQRGAA